MDEAELAEFVVAHETALVDFAADTEDATLAGVLPDDIVTTVGQHRRVVSIHSNHELIFGQLTYEVLVVEIAVGIDQGLLIVGALEHIEELME